MLTAAEVRKFKAGLEGVAHLANMGTIVMNRVDLDVPDVDADPTSAEVQEYLKMARSYTNKAKVICRRLDAKLNSVEKLHKKAVRKA